MKLTMQKHWFHPSTDDMKVNITCKIMYDSDGVLCLMLLPVRIQYIDGNDGQLTSMDNSSAMFTAQISTEYSTKEARSREAKLTEISIIKDND
jgi:hypothetical protein